MHSSLCASLIRLFLSFSLFTGLFKVSRVPRDSCTSRRRARPLSLRDMQLTLSEPWSCPERSRIPLPRELKLESCSTKCVLFLSLFFPRKRKLYLLALPASAPFHRVHVNISPVYFCDILENTGNNKFLWYARNLYCRYGTYIYFWIQWRTSEMEKGRYTDRHKRNSLLSSAIKNIEIYILKSRGCWIFF